MKIPKTPFSTRLSGSAKETELRIRSIFQWKKKRPPAVLIVLVAIVLLSICGGLIAFRTADPEQPAGDPAAEASPGADDPAQETLATPSDTNDPAAVLAAMESVTAESFLYPEYFGRVTAEQLAAALNAAVEHRISEEEFMDALGGSYAGVFPHWYIDSAWLERSSDVYSSLDRHFQIYCGLPENIVEVTLSEDNHQDTAYFRDETLYQLVRHKDDYEEIVDPAAYAKFKHLLVPKMESVLAQMENNPGNFTGYELKRFDLAWSYEDGRNGSQVELYHFGFGLLTDTPETVGWAGGMALDSKLRVSADLGPGQLAVKYRNGQVVCTAFMGSDFYYSSEDTGLADWAKERINGALDWAESQAADAAVSQVLPADARQPVLDYLSQEYFYAPVCYLGEEPSAPQEGDWRIDSISYQGETRLYETVGRAYDLAFSSYYSSEWHQNSFRCLILSLSADGTFNAIEGISRVTTESMPAEKIIREIVWGLSDLEVSLFRDGYPNPVGPGTGIPFYREAYDGPETVEVHEDWEPIYQEGDYWAVHRWSGVEALCYYRLADTQTGYYDIGVNTFDTTRTDLRTYRGIRVGDSREKVVETYPELKSGDYWGKYTGEDYLWYCTSEQDFGAALIFFFENDAVSRIVLTNMFN